MWGELWVQVGCHRAETSCWQRQPHVLGDSSLGGLQVAGICRSLLGSAVACACVSGWVSSSEQDEAGGVVGEEKQRTSAAVQRWEQRWAWGW